MLCKYNMLFKVNATKSSGLTLLIIRVGGHLIYLKNQQTEKQQQKRRLLPGSHGLNLGRDFRKLWDQAVCLSVCLSPPESLLLSTNSFR